MGFLINNTLHSSSLLANPRTTDPLYRKPTHASRGCQCLGSSESAAPILAVSRLSTTSPHCEYGEQFEYHKRHEEQQCSVTLTATCYRIQVAFETGDFTRYLTRALAMLPSALSGDKKGQSFAIQRSELPKTRFNVNRPHKDVIS